VLVGGLIRRLVDSMPLAAGIVFGLTLVNPFHCYSMYFVKKWLPELHWRGMLRGIA
jgi:hypothetical protein